MNGSPRTLGSGRLHLGHQFSLCRRLRAPLQPLFDGVGLQGLRKPTVDDVFLVPAWMECFFFHVYIVGTIMRSSNTSILGGESSYIINSIKHKMHRHLHLHTFLVWNSGSSIPFWIPEKISRYFTDSPLIQW